MYLIKREENQDADGNRGQVVTDVVIEDCDNDSIMEQLQSYYDMNGIEPFELTVHLDDHEGETHEIILDREELGKYIGQLDTITHHVDSVSVNDHYISEDAIIALNTKFEEFYNKSIKFIEQIPVGTLIYGTWLEEVEVISEPFVDSNEIGVWVQVESTSNVSESIPRLYKDILSLSTYGISRNGTHNLVFLSKEDAEEYKKVDWMIGTSFEVDHDGPSRIPIWINHLGRGSDKVMTQEEYDALPRRSWSCVTNDFDDKE